ncbi:RNA-binding La domain protein [Phyllosticta citriasiana]|uniref:RNA-binding La domain protein n=1 Tax=Phyllosticta citriasiana TaxID=595635 RepID=UPI0030FDB4C4
MSENEVKPVEAESAPAVEDQNVDQPADAAPKDAPAETEPKKEESEAKPTEAESKDGGEVKPADQTTQEEKPKSEDVDDSKLDKRPTNKNFRGSGQRGGKYRSQRVSTYAGEESNDPVEIRKQVEFYFSDSNLPLDKYLMDKTGGYENKPIPIKVIHNFSRMRRFQPYSDVVKALKESDFLEVVDNEEVRRKVPLAEKFGNKFDDQGVRIFNDHTMPRSIYAKGFGEENEMTQFNIEKFFLQYDSFKSVRLRRTFPSKKFKGSVFVEFEDEATQQAFLKLDPKPKYEGKDLLIMSKKDYVEMKAKDIADGKIKPQPTRPPHYNGIDRSEDWNKDKGNFQRGGRGRGGRGRGRGGRAGRGGRGGRGPNDRNRERQGKDEEKEEKKAPKVDARGIPIVEVENPAPKEENKKRAREDDGAPPEGNSPKKAKADEASATA